MKGNLLVQEHRSGHVSSFFYISCRDRAAELCRLNFKSVLATGNGKISIVFLFLHLIKTEISQIFLFFHATEQWKSSIVFPIFHETKARNFFDFHLCMLLSNRKIYFLTFSFSYTSGK